MFEERRRLGSDHNLRTAGHRLEYVCQNSDRERMKAKLGFVEQD